MTPSDLADALAAHHSWLASAGREGERLQVLDGDLSGVPPSATG